MRVIQTDDLINQRLDDLATDQAKLDNSALEFTKQPEVKWMPAAPQLMTPQGPSKMVLFFAIVGMITLIYFRKAL